MIRERWDIMKLKISPSIQFPCRVTSNDGVTVVDVDDEHIIYISQPWSLVGHPMSPMTTEIEVFEDVSLTLKQKLVALWKDITS